MSAGINADSAYDGHAVVGKDRATVASKEGSLSYVRPLGRRDRQSPWKPYLVPNPLPHNLSPHPTPFIPISVSKPLAKVKLEHWRRSGDDNFHFKVDGIKLFPFHVATGERWGEANLLFIRGGLNQQGFGPYPKPYFSSQYVSEICLLTGHLYTHESHEQQSWFALSGHKNRNATVYPNEMQHGSGNTYVLSQLCFLDFSFLHKSSFSCGEISKSIRTLWHSVSKNCMFYK